jgi:microcystin-dependent protein
MADPFVAEIRMFGFNFPPTGWAWCDGQLMPLSQNTALFALLGTMYGGNGKSNFALPDLAGRAPMQWGQGPGLTDRYQGEPGGAESVTLLESEIPAHSHQLRAATQDNADVHNVGPAASFAPSTGGTLYQDAPNTQLAAEALTPSGGSLPHSNMQPYLTIAFAIALQGIFPPRN